MKRNIPLSLGETVGIRNMKAFIECSTRAISEVVNQYDAFYLHRKPWRYIKAPWVDHIDHEIDDIITPPPVASASRSTDYIYKSNALLGNGDQFSVKHRNHRLERAQWKRNNTAFVKYIHEEREQWHQNFTSI